jgi:threonine/homoserine efflux transporter RhtA
VARWRRSGRHRLALAAGACWAAYILLTQKVGDEVTGVRGLAVSMPVAALVATAVAGPSVLGRLTWQVVLVGLGLALLLPVVPFCLELLALRRLTTAAFGTLMSLEPAAALLVGAVALHQDSRPGRHGRRRVRGGRRDRCGTHGRPGGDRADVSRAPPIR